MNDEYYNEIQSATKDLQMLSEKTIEHLKDFGNYETNAFCDDARKEAFILGMQNLMKYILKLKDGTILKEFDKTRNLKNG